MGAGNGHKPSPNCAGAMFCSHRCRRPLLNTDKRQLDPIRSSQIAMQVERHHFLCLPFAARKSYAFDFFDFSLLNLMASYPSTTARSFDILIPVVAYHGPFKPPMLVYTSDFHVVASTSLSLKSGPTEKRCLASCGTALELAKRWNGGNKRFDWSIFMSYSCRIHRCLSHWV